MTYVMSCSEKKFAMTHQTCANDTKDNFEGKIDKCMFTVNEAEQKTHRYTDKKSHACLNT